MRWKLTEFYTLYQVILRWVEASAIWAGMLFVLLVYVAFLWSLRIKAQSGLYVVYKQPVSSSFLCSPAIFMRSCSRCKRDNKVPKPFSDDNGMGGVPHRLKDVTLVEQMLISRACAIVRVYRLRP